MQKKENNREPKENNYKVIKQTKISQEITST